MLRVLYCALSILLAECSIREGWDPFLLSLSGLGCARILLLDLQSTGSSPQVGRKGKGGGRGEKGDTAQSRQTVEIVHAQDQNPPSILDLE